MDRLHFLTASIGIGMAGLTGKKFNFNTLPGKEDLVQIWQISGALTLEFADAMPASDYGFRPVDSDAIYTYGEQMQHIAENNISLLRRYMTGKPAPDIQNTRKDDKSAIKQNIRTSFDYGTGVIRDLTTESLSEVVDFSSRSLPRWHVLFIAQDHTTHHCGQAVVYLNAKGIAPPSYRKW